MSWLVREHGACPGGSVSPRAPLVLVLSPLPSLPPRPAASSSSANTPASTPRPRFFREPLPRPVALALRASRSLWAVPCKPRPRSWTRGSGTTSTRIRRQGAGVPNSPALMSGTQPQLLASAPTPRSMPPRYRRHGPRLEQSSRWPARSSPPLRELPSPSTSTTRSLSRTRWGRLTRRSSPRTRPPSPTRSRSPRRGRPCSRTRPPSAIRWCRRSRRFNRTR